MAHLPRRRSPPLTEPRLGAPLQIRAYLDHFEKSADVPLYDVMAV